MPRRLSPLRVPKSMFSPGRLPFATRPMAFAFCRAGSRRRRRGRGGSTRRGEPSLSFKGRRKIRLFRSTASTLKYLPPLHCALNYFNQIAILSGVDEHCPREEKGRVPLREREKSSTSSSRESPIGRPRKTKEATSPSIRDETRESLGAASPSPLPSLLLLLAFLLARAGCCRLLPESRQPQQESPEAVQPPFNHKAGNACPGECSTCLRFGFASIPSTRRPSSSPSLPFLLPSTLLLLPEGSRDVRPANRRFAVLQQKRLAFV